MTKKRFLFLALSLLLILSLSACGQETTPSPTPDAQAGSKYVFSYKGVSLPMNAEFAPLLETLGEPDSYFEAASCAFDGLDKFYTYGGMELTTYPDGDQDYISAIRLLDDSLSTPEGITLGCTPEDATAAYGEAGEVAGDLYIWSDGDATLSVLFEDGKAISIEYTAVNDLLS